MSEQNELFLHLHVRVVVNDNNWRYQSPNVQKEFDVTIPADLFAPVLFKDKIAKIVSDGIAEFPKAKEKFEAERLTKSEDGIEES